MAAPNITSRLQTALRDAMKARDALATAAIRSALATIDNAQAVDPAAAPARQPGRIAGGVTGLGAGEVPRRELSDEEIIGILGSVISEWNAAAADYDRAGRADAAARLRGEAEALERVLEAPLRPGVGA